MNKRRLDFEAILAFTKVIETKPASATSPDNDPMIPLLNENTSLATSGKLVLNMFVDALRANVLAESMASAAMYEPSLSFKVNQCSSLLSL